MNGTGDLWVNRNKPDQKKNQNQTPCFLSCTESRGNKKRDDTEVEATEKGKGQEGDKRSAMIHACHMYM